MLSKESLKNKKIAVFGLGKSGKATVRFLLKKKISVIIWNDDKKAIDEVLSEHKGNRLLQATDYKEYNWSEIAYLVLAAGVPFTHPEPHAIVKLAQKNHCPVVCDVEILYKFYPDNTYVGITGTNGKSTITALLGHVFGRAKVKSAFGGNLGNTAALDLKEFKKDAVYVIEMSSYMLDLIQETKFNFSILTNITPDHYQRHGDLAGYIKAKKRVFLNHDKNCYAIINVDDKNSAEVYEELKKDKKYKGNLVPVSASKIVSGGLSLIDGVIYDSFKKKETKIVLGETPYLKGRHNAENIICVYAVASLYGLESQKVSKFIKEFKGLDHRMQFIRKIRNVNFINDSKATNDTATEQAMKSNTNIYWILGGRPKPSGIDILDKYFDRVVYAFLIGEATEEFAKVLDKGRVVYFKCGNLENAFNEAVKLAQKESKDKEINVLLSPACASWDQWENFEKRGEYFAKLANELIEWE